MLTESIFKRILLWLISFFYTPVTQTETQTQEESTMSDIPVVDVATQTSAVTLQASDDVTITSPALNGTGVLQQSAATEAKAGVADLDAALNFIDSGVAQLGDAAKDELKELAKKYL